MSSTITDLRHGIQSLRRSPWYTTFAVLTLALGIGTSIAMFTVVQGVILDPLPYGEPDRLVLLWNRHERTGADKVQISGPDFLDYGTRSRSLVELAAVHNSFDSSITGEGSGEQIDLAIVSANFFDFLGRPPMAGVRLRIPANFMP